MDALSWARLQDCSLILHEKTFDHNKDANWHHEDLVFDDHDLFLCCEGSARFTLPDRTIVLRPGDMFLLGAGTHFSSRIVECTRFRAFAQHFEFRLYGAVDFFAAIHYEPVVRVNDIDMDARCFRTFYAGRRSGTWPMVSESLFLYILSEFIAAAFRGRTRLLDPRFEPVLRIVEALSRGYARKEILDEALRHRRYSMRHTTALFKEATGVTPRQYLEDVRLTHARRLLSQGYSVKESGLAVGFEDEAYFGKVFRKVTGSTPGAYRRRAFPF